MRKDKKEFHKQSPKLLKSFSSSGQLLFILAAFLVALAWMTRNKSSKLQQKAPPCIFQNEQPKRNGLLITMLGCLAILTLGGGFYLDLLTLPPDYPSLESKPVFDVSVRYDRFDGRPKLLKDYDVVLWIRIANDKHNAVVSIWVREREIEPVGTTFIPPRFDFVWPGRISLTDDFLKMFGDIYDVREIDNTTTIISKSNVTPFLEFIWWDAVEQLGLFRHRVSLRVSERVDPQLDWNASDRKYKVLILLDLPPESRVVYQQPTTVENVVTRNNELQGRYEIGIATREYPFTDVDYTVSQSNFDVVFEDMNTDKRLNILLVGSGIAFGLAGNLLVTLLVMLVSPTNRV
jgi:hypothetical protein